MHLILETTQHHARDILAIEGMEVGGISGLRFEFLRNVQRTSIQCTAFIPGKSIAHAFLHILHTLLRFFHVFSDRIVQEHCGLQIVERAKSGKLPALSLSLSE